jgi:general secretion pathway protein A
MHEEYYGFAEKPFSLTPDPKYLYKSGSHANAFDLLQYAISRREGFVVVTGDVGTGKTTLCRAVLEQLDRRTFAALVLNPFLSEEDLLRLILQDFGVVSRDDIKRGRLAGVSKQELIDTLNRFLLSLVSLRASALLIIDEAQSLPHPVLEQIRILSNLETDKEKLLQIVLVGQVKLREQLRLPDLRQLDQRVSMRCELKPLTHAETTAYIAHRLTIAGGGSVVSFAPKALDLVHNYSAGVPRLINFVCDRALRAGYSAGINRIAPQMVTAAASSLDLAAPQVSMFAWVRRHAGAFAAGAAVTAALATATWYGVATLQARVLPRNTASARTAQIEAVARPSIAIAPAAAEKAGAADLPRRPEPSPLPQTRSVQPIATTGSRAADSVAAPRVSGTAGVNGLEHTPLRYSVLVASFRQESEAAALADQLRGVGYESRIRRIDSDARGLWQQVVIGPYADIAVARADEARIRQLPGYGDARLTTR